MKEEIRKKALQERNSVSEFEIQEKSKRIWSNLFSMPEFASAQKVMFYVNIGSEVETKRMIKRALELGKEVIVPIADFKDNKLLLSRINSISELGENEKTRLLEPKEEFSKPADAKELDLLIVPGISFDFKGNRIGYGRGFYDKFISGAELNESAVLIGLAFEMQLQDCLPSNGSDCRVHKIVTEKRIINC
ncbi:MAG: 5-formyltetrahydrofolate cyclo-ligase [Candidatus Diapherotrites archaeon]|nr:5-formyltetrahydrofolate cyclo-ligase [Candidatus Diapherotrites archaeon]